MHPDVPSCPVPRVTPLPAVRVARRWAGCLALLLLPALSGCNALWPARDQPAPVVDRSAASPPAPRVSIRPTPQPAPRGQDDAVLAVVTPLVDPLPARAEPVRPVSPPEARAAPAPTPSRPAGVGGLAVQTLLAQADRQALARDYGAATASLERALKIDNRNPLLWQRLAELRLEQGQLAQAEQLAVRANALGAGDADLLARNWRLIASARQRQGDRQGAAEALDRARRVLEGR